MEKKKKLIILGVILLLIIVSGATFAILTWNSTMIKLGINTNCFTIDYTRGGDITGSLKLVNEEDLISNGKFSIKEGVGVSGVNIGINSNCSIEGFGSIYLNVTNISDVFTTGDSKGALKYAVLKNTSTIANPTNINTTSLLNQSFDIIAIGSITSNDKKLLYRTELSNTELYKYIIVVYVDNNLAGNNVTKGTFAGNISSDASQLVDTPDYCFASNYNTSNMAASIVSYNCSENNKGGYEPITDVIKIPSYIKGVKDITLKNNPTEEARKTCANWLPSYANAGGLSFTSEQATTICNDGSVNGITLEVLLNEYKEQLKNEVFIYSGMFDITYDDNTKYKVTSIKGYAYDDLAFDYIDADIVILPSTLTSIEHQTFYEGKFNYITIPSSVTTIGPGALSLTHNLRMIYNKTGKSFDWCDVFQYYPCSIDTSDGGITGVVTLGNSSEDTKSIIITN